MFKILKLYTNIRMLMKVAQAMQSAADGKNPTYNSLLDIGSSFWDGLTGSQSRSDKKLHENLDELQIDKMIEDSFPASDAPSTY